MSCKKKLLKGAQKGGSKKQRILKTSTSWLENGSQFYSIYI